MSLYHPKGRIPLWAAFAVPAAAYVFRSVALRGGDFSLDVPSDVVAFTVFAVGFGAVAWSRNRSAQQRDQEPPEEHKPEHDAPADEGQHDEIVRDVE